MISLVVVVAVVGPEFEETELQTDRWHLIDHVTVGLGVRLDAEVLPDGHGNI